MRTVRTDQPSATDSVARSESLPERMGDRDELRRRLQRLPPGHPSSPVEGDGTPKPPDPGLRCREPSDAQQTREADEPHEGDRTHEGDRRPLSDAEHAEHVGEVRALLEKARADGLATDQQHTVDPAREVWSDERDVLHDSIIEDLYARASDVPCERRAIMAGGLPGAGKSTVLERYAGIDRSQYLTINPDVVKEELARRGMIPPVSGLSPMESSDLVHEESSHLAKRLAHRAQADGKNVIWDVTMASRASTEGRIGALREAGYTQIEGIFVDIPVEESVSRADSRHRQGQADFWAGDGVGGRFIPAEMIKAHADPEWGSCNRKVFEEVKAHFDHWYRFDNSGSTPILTEAGRRKEDHGDD
jgi:predicted kinase